MLPVEKTLGFSHLSLLKDELLSNLASLDYHEMTPIQEKSLPFMLKGDDVIAQAKTGSGKTAAFGLTILNGLQLKCFAVQSLVLCPTRELAEQVSQSLRMLARQLPHVKIINLSGGLPMRPQENSLKHGVHIIVGTPGRVQKHLDKGTLVLDKLTLLVLDEADKMLDMGFLEDLRVLIKKCPRKRQTILFSATFPAELKQLAHEFMQQPHEVTVDDVADEHHIQQVVYELKPKEKFKALTELLKHHPNDSTLIFCNTKQSTNEVVDRLKNEGFSAVALNGDMEQVDRDLAMIQFINQSYCILVATDIAARGLDIEDLPLVINYEPAHDPETHLHRIGRTGRAGKHGLAITLSSLSEDHRVAQLVSSFEVPPTFKNSTQLRSSPNAPAQPTMMTLSLNVGKKDKIRAGDIVGALTKEGALPVEVIGKINVFAMKSYVAVNKSHAKQACQVLQKGTIKGRRVLSQLLR
ncbi:MAG: ATP-dependent RNA helicase DbpA [Legionellaceae bacterium]